MIKNTAILTLLTLLFSACASTSTHQKNIDDFVRLYKTLDIPTYDLSHEKNVAALLDLLKNPNLETDLNKLTALSANCGTSNSCKMIRHEALRIKKRLSFAEKLNVSKVKNLTDLKKKHSLYKESYLLSIAEWTNDFNFSIEEISKFEIKEIKRIRKELSSIRKVKHRKTSSPEEVTQYLEKLNEILEKNIKTVFTKSNVPKVIIKQNKNESSQHIPGYYDQSTGTFCFSMPKEGVYLGDLDWLFLHEALPGHHLQAKLDTGSLATQLFNRTNIYLDFIEGWAAYVETYGSSLGVYKNDAAKKKALEWDLLRSTRVLLDIGIHLKSWDTKRAKREWKSLAPEVYPLADREIARIQRWPAQVISYEYGKMKIINARDNFLKTNKSILLFHEKLLKTGQLPTFLL